LAFDAEESRPQLHRFFEGRHQPSAERNFAGCRALFGGWFVIPSERDAYDGGARTQK
jgi:hypothetical protein